MKEWEKQFDKLVSNHEEPPYYGECYEQIKSFIQSLLDEQEKKFYKFHNKAMEELQEIQRKEFVEVFDYCIHDRDCIAGQWRQGKPTEDGDYLSLFGYGKNEKWYSRNKKEKPECSCGLDSLINKYKETE